MDSSPGVSLETSPAASRPVSARTTTTEAPQEELEAVEESPVEDMEAEPEAAPEEAGPEPGDEMGEEPPADDDMMDDEIFLSVEVGTTINGTFHIALNATSTKKLTLSLRVRLNDHLCMKTDCCIAQCFQNF